MILLPIIVIILLFGFFLARNSNVPRAAANTWIWSMLGIWLMTELLSTFSVLNTYFTAGVWMLYMIVLCVAWHKYGILNRIREIMAKDFHLMNLLKKYKKILIPCVIFIIFVVITAALQTQKNTDSMIYHLPRIMHWIENESVEYYATDTDLQNRYPALAEYLVMQLFLLGLPDRLANMVQTCAYILSGIMVFGLGRRLGASHAMALLSSVIYWFMPMALTQTYTTQTDNIAGMFLLVNIYFVLDLIDADALHMNKKGFVTAVRYAICVMLGYLCKPTICFVMVVFFMWMCITRVVKRDRILTLLKFCIVGISVAVILYTPLLLRNYLSYQVRNGVSAEVSAEMENNFVEANHNALAPDSFNVTNALKDPRFFAMTCMQNMARNSTSVCFPFWNEYIRDKVELWKGVTDTDVGRFAIQSHNEFFQDDTASNPAFMYLILAVCILSLYKKNCFSRRQRIYFICGLAGFVIQCGMMGYTLYRTRYLVGAMAVLTPIIGLAIQNLRCEIATKKCIITVVVFAISFGAINTVSLNFSSLCFALEGDSIQGYFKPWKLGNEKSCRELLNHINNNGYTKVGIQGRFTYEYILWKEIASLNDLKNVNVKHNIYKQYEDQSFVPQCIIEETDGAVQIGDVMECHGVEYVCEWNHGGEYLNFAVYVPKEIYSGNENINL